MRGYNNPYGFALQFIEADHLDETFNREIRNDGRIEMSVEMDRFRKPTAYHLLVKAPNGGYLQPGNERIRVPASEIIHGYVVNRPAQVRGIPWAVSAMSRLHMLGAYEESELVAARVASAKMGFLPALMARATLVKTSRTTTRPSWKRSPAHLSSSRQA